MPRIEQPLTQIHFVPPQLFLVNVGDITYGHSNAVVSAASSTPFRVVVQPEKVQIFAVRLSTIWH